MTGEIHIMKIMKCKEAMALICKGERESNVKIKLWTLRSLLKLSAVIVINYKLPVHRVVTFLIIAPYKHSYLLHYLQTTLFLNWNETKIQIYLTIRNQEVLNHYISWTVKCIWLKFTILCYVSFMQLVLLKGHLILTRFFVTHTRVWSRVFTAAC